MNDNGTALVVVGHGEASRRLLRHAGDRAAGKGVDMVVLTIMPDADYEDRYRAREGIPHLDMPYTVEAAEEEGQRHAKRLAREALADLDVEYVVESRVGRRASIVLDAAREHDCTEIYLAGSDDGPWHDTTFNRVFDEVLRRFDGPVTVILGPERSDSKR